MQKKLAAYFFLSLLSFTFFTFIFRTVADAQTTDEQITQQETSSSVPTPTLYIEQQPSQPPTTPVPAKITTHASTVNTPTPTVFLYPTETPAPVAGTEFVQPVATKEIASEDTKDEPTPTDAPKPTLVVAADMETLFSTYADMYHVDREEMKKIAKCESGFNANAQNGPYTGMFQFDASTWIAERTRMGLDTNPDLRTNMEEAIKTTAHKIASSGLNAWPVCH
jgi:hypothetical protein